MHHIKKIQLLNRVREDQVNAIRAYLHSEKFSNNPMVNRNDIFLRLDEYESAISEVESGRVPSYLENEFASDGSKRENWQIKAIQEVKEIEANKGNIIFADECLSHPSFDRIADCFKRVHKKN